MIEGIIHNSLGAAESLNTRMHARMMSKKKELPYKATSFFSVIKHPTQNKWVSIVNRKTITPVVNEMLSEFTSAELNSIEPIGDDWFNNEL
jgi:hypothetical protein